MRGIINFQREIIVRYTYLDMKGYHKVNYKLKGKCAIRFGKIEFKERNTPKVDEKKLYIEGFHFPLEVYHSQIEPHLQWIKVHTLTVLI